MIYLDETDIKLMFKTYVCLEEICNDVCYKFCEINLMHYIITKTVQSMSSQGEQRPALIDCTDNYP